MRSAQTRSLHDGLKQQEIEVARAQRRARALGWFSIGLGVTEIAAPGAVARLTGIIDVNRGLMRALGVREIVHGVGILTHRKPVGWLWSRVFGDVIDLAVLGKAAASPHANRRRVVAAATAVTGVTVLDFMTSQQFTRVADTIEDDDAIHVTKTIIINRPAEEIYRFWREFKNLPRVMEHLESVEVIDDKRSLWAAKGPAGKRVQWEAAITEDRPNELIAWRSSEGSTVENSGRVRFEPAPGIRGTLVRVELNYRPPGGLLAATFAKLLGEEPELQLEEDLRRLKQLMETGEIITTEGQPAGRAKSTSWKYDHAARRLAAGL
ncbi:MAG TPA: SRPBCC family protein [Candidatus Binatia bacterium]